MTSVLRVVLGLGLGLAPGLIGCLSDPDRGTAVGNPTVLALQLADGDGVDFVSGEADATLVRLTNPDETFVLSTGTSLNLVSDASLRARPGDWTALTLKFDGGITLATAGLERTLPVEQFSVVGDFTTNSPLLLEVAEPGWVDTRTWAEASPVDLAELLVWGTSLYEDTDGDGSLDEYEEAAGALACARCEPEAPVTDTGEDTGGEAAASTSSSYGHHGDDSRREE